jgi:hypothetical protein
LRKHRSSNDWAFVAGRQLCQAHNSAVGRILELVFDTASATVGNRVMRANAMGRLRLSGCSSQAEKGEVAAPLRMEESAELRFGRSRLFQPGNANSGEPRARNPRKASTLGRVRLAPPPG